MLNVSYNNGPSCIFHELGIEEFNSLNDGVHFEENAIEHPLDFIIVGAALL